MSMTRHRLVTGPGHKNPFKRRGPGSIVGYIVQDGIRAGGIYTRVIPSPVSRVQQPTQCIDTEVS